MFDGPYGFVGFVLSVLFNPYFYCILIIVLVVIVADRRNKSGSRDDQSNGPEDHS